MPKQIPDEITNVLHWIFSEYWNVFVMSKLGYHDMIEDKTEEIIKFLKQNGITESNMALENDIDQDALVEFINKFNLNQINL